MIVDNIENGLERGFVKYWLNYVLIIDPLCLMTGNNNASAHSTRVSVSHSQSTAKIRAKTRGTGAARLFFLF